MLPLKLNRVILHGQRQSLHDVFASIDGWILGRVVRRHTAWKCLRYTRQLDRQS